MNAKQMNFRTKTQAKHKSMSLSHQFIKIQKVLTQYQKKKFHPKIQNFHYMSSQSISKSVQKRKFLLKKDAQTFSSQKVFGPLPDVFIQNQTKKKTQKSYDISQITLASSEERQTYTKMSKLRNPQKRRRLKDSYPKHSERYIQTINKNFMELLGKQVEYVNSTSSRDMFYEDDRTFTEFPKQRNCLQTKTHQQGDNACKKYAQIELDEFLEQNTKLTVSQKRRITEYKKRDEFPKESQDLSSSRKNAAKTSKKDRSFILIDEFNNEDSTKLKTEMAPKMFDKVDFEDEPINFSSKGWIIAQNNDSNIMTL